MFISSGTKQIKIALTKHSKSLIRHGVQEVTIGYITGGESKRHNT